MRPLVAWKVACVCLLICFAAIGATGQSFTSLASFDGSNGTRPWVVVQGTDGNFYGTTEVGGNQNADCPAGNGAGCGTVFKVTPGGVLSTLYKFCSKTSCSDGDEPTAGLALGTDGNFYGVTSSGGTHGSCTNAKAPCGTIFKITPSGKLTTLYNFCALTNCADGATPLGGLIQGVDGYFYGTTSAGGANQAGTLFRFNSAGALTTLYSFCALKNCTDGSAPTVSLIQGTNGSFYGTTSLGGSTNPCFNPNFAPGCGTLFQFTASTRTLTNLYVFHGDGGAPNALIQGSDGTLYGTTELGGTTTSSLCGVYGCGAVFKVAAKGVDYLHVFCTNGGTGTCADGAQPVAGLIQATDGNFYGTTVYSTLFTVTAAGALTTLHTFTGPDGLAPGAPVFQGTDGKFYGTTGLGGNSSSCTEGCGTVFSLDRGIGPFVSFIRSLGTVGHSVEILGQGFTGTTSISFNGTPAAFTVVSDTYLTATVPAGASTGFVTVNTHTGVLQSNKFFRVMAEILSFLPTSGPVGTPVVITGNSFTGTTEVVFDQAVNKCKPASFTVDSDTQITAIVPAGAGSGTIAVHTPVGSTSTVVPFEVAP